MGSLGSGGNGLELPSSKPSFSGEKKHEQQIRIDLHVVVVVGFYVLLT